MDRRSNEGIARRRAGAGSKPIEETTTQNTGPRGGKTHKGLGDGG
jgi:hypothetical protein